jgi:glucosamine-6-phosphate deaminase
MNVQIYPTEELVGEAAAMLIAARLIEQPETVLGLATGSTPLGTYAELIRMNESGLISFSEVTTFNLDEYIGLDHDHEQSYFRFMVDNLLDAVDIDKDAVHVLYGCADDPEQECADFETMIYEAGGIDLQLLGLGNNGHVGFNEPAETFSPVTHIVSLTEETIRANARFFDSIDDVPKEALTMGIGTIMAASKIVMVVTGKHKAKAVKAMIEGPVDPQCPASILQLHADATILLDSAAASLLFEEDEDE